MKRLAGFRQRRKFLARAMPGLVAVALSAQSRSHEPDRLVMPERRWYEAAAAMKGLAESWGDQSYGAVVVLGDAIIGNGPSRVVQRRDPSAHAEREAIRDAQLRTGREQLSGSILYSTSRPCAECERAAADAGIARMVHGEMLTDSGRPKR